MSLRFLFLESFFGGSHREFAEGLAAHSRHHIDLVTLPARWWKWRMRGAALYFFKQVSEIQRYDGLIVTDLMSLSDLKALWGAACPPALVYFHESQLTYPLAPSEVMDYQYGFTDITTCLAAQRICFNSQYHLDAFFRELPRFIDRMPEFRPHWVVVAIRAKAGVIHPGCRFPRTLDLLDPPSGQPPLVIWNHRWEHDKNPETFFEALDRLANRSVAFRLAVLGERFRKAPPIFTRARKRFAKQIVQWGYAPDRKTYTDWLHQGTVVVSTAGQENFGMAVVEAMRAGCLPLLPRRLSYPELLPEDQHAEFFYDTQDELVDKLARLLARFPSYANERRSIAQVMGRFSWEHLGEEYNRQLEALAAAGRPVIG
jgi:glycosyltransferase involved in cell wall biosynthesis